MHRFSIPIVISLVALLFACSSNRDTFLNRAYQDTTSRYNAYFNANLRMEQAKENILLSHNDDFSRILSLYPERNIDLAGTYSTDYDEIIKKSSRAIKLREISKWTDDHYLLVGQAYFMKGEYQSALESFQYIITNHPDDNIPTASSGGRSSAGQGRQRRSRQPASRAQLQQQQADEMKEEREEAQEQSFFDRLRHHAARWDALIWAMYTYTEMGKNQQAEAVLTLINSKSYFPPQNLEELYRAEAHLRITTGDYEEAIVAMEKYIDQIRRNRNKIRPTYILAQLYERANQPSQAIEHYQAVLGNRPNYELEFNSNMSIARIASSDGVMSLAEVEKMLTRMLRDNNNREFFDQIYFALAELELSRGNQTAAIEFLEKSIDENQGNALQLGLAYLRIGEIHFNNEHYFKAAPGYQNAASNLPSDYENIDEVQKLASVLGRLTEQLSVISENDSLIKLANLPEAEMMLVLREKAAKQIAEEEERTRATEEEASAEDFFRTERDVQQVNQGGRTQTGSGWYFYNQSAVSSGFNEFVSRWGNRKREDNWRRIDKSTSDQVDEEDLMALDDFDLDDFDLDEEEVDAFDRLINQYLSGLPIEPEQLEEVNNAMIEAFYTKGYIYRNELDNQLRAVESFETLLEMFPQNTYRAEVSYILYLLHGSLGNTQRELKYKQIVLNEFPESMFARSIQQPEGVDEDGENLKIAEQLYASAYSAYQQNNFDYVFSVKPKADSLAGGHPIQAKFALLTALSIGKTDSLEVFKSALENLKTNFPGTEQHDMADRILIVIHERERIEAGAKEEYGGLTQQQMDLASVLSKYELNLLTKHSIIIVNENKDVPSRKIINPLAQYNDKKHSLTPLQISPLVIGTPNTLILVQSFSSGQGAMNYYNDLVSNRKEIFPDVNTDKLAFYVISEENLQKVMKERELESYIEFFEATYLK